MEAAVQTPQAQDIRAIAEQLVKLSEFFQSIESKTRVYQDNAEGNQVQKLVQAADTVRNSRSKNLDKIQYLERKEDARNEYILQQKIAKKEYQISRKLGKNVTFEKIHYMKDAFKQSRTHRNAITSAFSAFFTGLSLGSKQTRINRYKKQIALITAKEAYRQAQKKTLQDYLSKAKTIRTEYKESKQKKPEKDTASKDMAKLLKKTDSKPFDVQEALSLGIIPRYGTPEYKALPQERKDALKLAVKKCGKQPENSNPITFKDFRELVDSYEQMIFVTRNSISASRERTRAQQHARNTAPRPAPARKPEAQKTRTMTR